MTATEVWDFMGDDAVEVELVAVSVQGTSGLLTRTRG
jgi:hypothetical protein